METGEGRIGRSLRLIGIAWRLIRSDRTMLALTFLSGVASIVATLILFRLSGWKPGDPSSNGRLLLTSMIAAYPLTFLSVFLNVALAAAAAEALEGRRIGVLDALGRAMERLGQIALWSLLAAGVGVLLQQLAERLPAGGRIASWILGAAWSLVTLFAIPILALEGCGAISCVRRSAELMRERWGEGLTGTVATNAAFAVAGGIFGFFIGIGVSIARHGGGGASFVLGFGLVGIVLMSTLAMAVRGVFAVALYRWAVDQRATGGFPQGDLAHPVVGRRRRLFRRR